MIKQANIAELKNQLSEFLEMVEHGDEILVCKRNVPFAKIAPLQTKRKNKSVPGCDRGKIKILGEITGPIIPEEDWNCLRDDFDIT